MNFLDDLERLGGIIPVGSGSLLPLPESEIEELERLSGKTFPADYRQFLSHAGGFVFNEEICFPIVDPLVGDFSKAGLAPMCGFFTSSAAKAHKTATLRWNIEQSPDYYPENLIAVGHDGAGGKILFDLNDDTKGTVSYYPQINSWFQSDAEDPFCVAASFEAFIKALRRAPKTIASKERHS